MHADSVDTVIRRLETPPINLNPSLVNLMDVVVIMTHALVDGHETRRLREVVEVVNVQPDGVALTNTPFMWDPSKDAFYFKKDSKTFEKIEKKYGILKEHLEKEFRIRTKIIYELFKRKIIGFEEVQKVINEYYKNPAAVLQKLGITDS
jgi:flagellar protein FlaI